jgi:hypothetical protein
MFWVSLKAFQVWRSIWLKALVSVLELRTEKVKDDILNLL